MKISFFIYSVIFTFLVLSCQSSRNRTTGSVLNNNVQEKGKVLHDVSCLKSPSLSYSLYLPSGYNQEVKYPLILAFDPQGSGVLPVEKYHTLAERNGYILMGSNNSKNGQSMDATETIVSAMFNEITSRYSVDTLRIYLMGFSGGARVASLVALYAGGVRGVIGCGAGFPGGAQPTRFRFDYIGMAGNADFNMNEMMNLDQQLEQQGFRHATILFEGKHEWPPVETMEYAFIWNDFCTKKDNKIALTHTEIADFIAKNQKVIQRDEDQNNLFQKKLDIEQEIRFLQDLDPNIDIEKKQLAELVSSEAYKKAEKKNLLLKEKEMQEQKMFTENFFVKDTTWWRKTITNYELRITNGKDHEEELMYKRIMSYLSLLAYMKYTGANGSGDKEKADFALKVYRIVDPENAAKINK